MFNDDIKYQVNGFFFSLKAAYVLIKGFWQQQDKYLIQQWLRLQFNEHISLVWSQENYLNGAI